MNIVTKNQSVVLELIGGVNGGYGPAKSDFMRNMPDGTVESGPGGLGWRVHSGQALVVTEMDWQYVHPNGAAGAGKLQTLRIMIQKNPSGPQSIALRVFESAIVLSPHGEGGTVETLASGFIVAHDTQICPDVMPGPGGPPSGVQHIILRGISLRISDESPSSVSSPVWLAARVASIVRPAAALSDTAIFILDIWMRFYLLSQRYETQNFPLAASRRGCRFSGRPTSSHMHGCGSGKIRWPNSNGDGQG